ncbi:hypothetical protein LOC70_23045 [Rhodopirellula sp. JC737]|nr:hypothetical protein [Rhodopirellula sp. JC737]
MMLVNEANPFESKHSDDSATKTSRTKTLAGQLTVLLLVLFAIWLRSSI